MRTIDASYTFMSELYSAYVNAGEVLRKIRVYVVPVNNG